jgi:thiamine biosynthesis lipoprotein
MLKISSILLIFLVFFSGACTKNTPQILSGNTMGTTWQVKLESNISQQTLQHELDKVNRIFSTWDEDSELSRLNKMHVNEWHKVSTDLFFVLESAKNLQTKTNGHFDAGIGALIDIWGFGKNKSNIPPSLIDIQNALKGASLKHLILKNGSVKKTKPIQINLSALAKGYGVDKISEFLIQKGVRRFLIEIGGEVKALGKWHIGIETQVQPIALNLNNISIATSGNYRNYFKWQDKFYAHILNPLDGLPVQNDLFSVSALHSSAMYADAYATAMMVMGFEKAIQWAKKFNLSVVFVRDAAHNFKIIKVNL